MLRETGAGLGTETMQKNLSVEREYERIKMQPRQEFNRIDVNQDGSITFEEIERFLNAQTNGQVETEMAQSIFNAIDENESGVIQLDEFIDAYFEHQKYVKERIQELEESLKANKASREQFLIKLQEQRKKQKLNSYHIDEDSLLTVKLIEARSLTPVGIQGSCDPYAVLSFEN